MSYTPHAKKHDSCTPHAQLRDSQLAVLHELSQLNAPRVGIMEMAVDISLPSLTITLPLYESGYLLSHYTAQIFQSSDLF